MPPTSTETLTTTQESVLNINRPNESSKLKHRIPTNSESELEVTSNSKLNVTGSKQSSKTPSTAEIDVHSAYFPPLQIVWKNVALFAYLHIAALYGAYLFVTGQVMWQTLIVALFTHVCGAFGITAGAHRLWSHKSFKAKLPLRIILAFMQTISAQNSIHEWSRDHRVHHKYSETHADPHNAKRGFFFAHIGWLLCRKHEAVKIMGKHIDLSDLESDPVIMFQKKYYTPLVLTLSMFLPAVIPWYFWGESFVTAWCFAAQFRYCVNLHCTWLVNSAAHMVGSRPYDKNISPSQNKMVAFWAFGEGWHNYHHVFPWDYKTAEFGHYKYNFTAAFVDFFAWIGWAYDLKTVSEKVIMQRIGRTGDGSHAHHEHGHHHHHGDGKDFQPGPWGWGDEDAPAEDIAVTETRNTLEEKNN